MERYIYLFVMIVISAFEIQAADTDTRIDKITMTEYQALTDLNPDDFVNEVRSIINRDSCQKIMESMKERYDCLTKSGSAGSFITLSGQEQLMFRYFYIAYGFETSDFFFNNILDYAEVVDNRWRLREDENKIYIPLIPSAYNCMLENKALFADELTEKFCKVMGQIKYVFGVFIKYANEFDSQKYRPEVYHFMIDKGQELSDELGKIEMEFIRKKYGND